MMNKKLFILFILSLVVIVVICTLNVRNQEKNNQELIAKTNETNAELQNKNYAKLIRYNGNLYKYNAEYVYPTCGVLDGDISSIVPSNIIPKNDGEANFEGIIGIQNGDGTFISAKMEDKHYIFIKVDENLSEEEILKDNTTYTDTPKTTERLIRLGDKLYRDTGEVIDCRHIIENKNRTSYSAMESEIPQRDRETNFFGCYFYFFDGDVLKVEIDEHYYWFEEYEI